MVNMYTLISQSTVSNGVHKLNKNDSVMVGVILLDFN